MDIIAYYLPQFHPIPENDEWWGKGFTEWTNVGKAKPLFRNHYQPKVPADLGYYDLRLPQVREEQAKLAKEAGISAFCYWHYWFGDGRRLLEHPFNEVINSGSPDFPFCLGWANESWKAKIWAKVKNKEDKTLIEQKYPGDDDIKAHFYEIINALRDKRYFRVDNKPVFVIYRPKLLPNPQNFIKIWNELLNKEGLGESFYFVGHTLYTKEISKVKELGFSNVNVFPLGDLKRDVKFNICHPFVLLRHFVFKKPLIYPYKEVIKYFSKVYKSNRDAIPCIVPNWDHTPRSGKNGVVFHNSNPFLFANHVKETIKLIKDDSDKIVFLKSWNEWGEGNYLEPDLKFGKSYIKALKENIYQ
jgi:lipopolysaccharide biosynthesis protein